MNEERDFPSLEAERDIKKAALACATYYNAGPEEKLGAAETLLLTLCLSHGLLSLLEFEQGSTITYDGYADAEGGEAYHHVYVHNRADAKLVLDIKCDH